MLTFEKLGLRGLDSMKPHSGKHSMTFATLKLDFAIDLDNNGGGSKELARQWTGLL